MKAQGASVLVQELLPSRLTLMRLLRKNTTNRSRSGRQPQRLLLLQSPHHKLRHPAHRWKPLVLKVRGMSMFLLKLTYDLNLNYDLMKVLTILEIGVTRFDKKLERNIYVPNLYCRLGGRSIGQRNMVEYHITETLSTTRYNGIFHYTTRSKV
jgi:hypothetical protein